MINQRIYNLAQLVVIGLATAKIFASNKKKVSGRRKKRLGCTKKGTVQDIPKLFTLVFDVQGQKKAVFKAIDSWPNGNCIQY